MGSEMCIRDRLHMTALTAVMRMTSAKFKFEMHVERENVYIQPQMTIGKERTH